MRDGGSGYHDPCASDRVEIFHRSAVYGCEPAVHAGTILESMACGVKTRERVLQGGFLDWPTSPPLLLHPLLSGALCVPKSALANILAWKRNTCASAKVLSMTAGATHTHESPASTASEACGTTTDAGKHRVAAVASAGGAAEACAAPAETDGWRTWQRPVSEERGAAAIDGASGYLQGGAGRTAVGAGGRSGERGRGGGKSEEPAVDGVADRRAKTGGNLRQGTLSFGGQPIKPLPGPAPSATRMDGGSQGTEPGTGRDAESAAALPASAPLPSSERALAQAARPDGQPTVPASSAAASPVALPTALSVRSTSRACTWERDAAAAQPAAAQLIEVEGDLLDNVAPDQAMCVLASSRCLAPDADRHAEGGDWLLLRQLESIFGGLAELRTSATSPSLGACLHVRRRGRVIYYLIACPNASQLDVQALRTAVSAMLQHMCADSVRSVATTRMSLCGGGDGITSIDAKAVIGGSNQSVGGQGSCPLNDRWVSDVRPAVLQVINSQRHSRRDITTPVALVVYSTEALTGIGIEP